MILTGYLIVPGVFGLDLTRSEAVRYSFAFARQEGGEPGFFAKLCVQAVKIMKAY